MFPGHRCNSLWFQKTTKVFSFWSSFDVKKPKKPMVFFMKKTGKKPTLSIWKKPAFEDVSWHFILVKQILSQGKVMITLQFGQSISVTRKGYDNPSFWSIKYCNKNGFYVMITVYVFSHFGNNVSNRWTCAQCLFVRDPLIFQTGSNNTEISSFFTFRLFIIYWFKSTLAA